MNKRLFLVFFIFTILMFSNKSYAAFPIKSTENRNQLNTEINNSNDDDDEYYMYSAGHSHGGHHSSSHHWHGVAHSHHTHAYHYHHHYHHYHSHYSHHRTYADRSTSYSEYGSFSLVMDLCSVISFVIWGSVVAMVFAGLGVFFALAGLLFDRYKARAVLGLIISAIGLGTLLVLYNLLII